MDAPVGAPVAGSNDVVWPADREALLRGVSLFAGLPADALRSIAGHLHEERFAAGDEIVREGDAGDRLYLIAQGAGEATTRGRIGPVLLEAYEAGEVFGELALVEADHVRHATVTATSDVLALTLDAETFASLVERYPQARSAFEEESEHLLTVKFLKAASPFARMDVDRLRRLADRLQPVSVPAAGTIVRQGEPGDACFLLRQGRAEVVVRSDDGTERTIAQLGPGTVIGETALLTDAPRNATVRATEPCEVLALHRDDLLEIMGADRQIGHQLVELEQLRDRPRRREGIEVGQRTTADGSVITTLKDPRRFTYFRLAPEGYFVWQRLDGSHTLRDLTLEYATAFKSFSPQSIEGVIQELAGAGFVETAAVQEGLSEGTSSGPSRWDRLSRRARRAIDWQVSLPNPDGLLARLYRSGVWLVYSWPAQALLALVAVVGLAVFAVNIGKAERATTQGGWVLLFLIAMYFVMIVLHESGHAFTVKRFGREVRRAGVGWYWFGPIAFADTSDMWMADRLPRIVVTIGGLYASVLVASVAAIVAVLLASSVLAAVLWQLAFLSLYAVVLNLNPLLELDGYFILMDWLDHPNLRRHSLAWLGSELPRALFRREELRRHKLELLYGLGAVLYIVLAGALMLTVYRVVVQGWLASILPLTVAAAIAWVLMIGLVALAMLTVIGDLRASRQGRAAAGH